MTVIFVLFIACILQIYDAFSHPCESEHMFLMHVLSKLWCSHTALSFMLCSCLVSYRQIFNRLSTYRVSAHLAIDITTQ